MARISHYWRPLSLEEAFTILDRPGAVLISGGVKVDPGPGPEPIEVVDLQALGLGRIDRPGGDALELGAMATLQQMVESDEVPVALSEAARREQPSTLRAQVTVGGCVMAAGPESELLATLLVHDAVVHIARRGQVTQRKLEALFADLPLPAGAIVTALTIATLGDTVARRTARTRADRAIVAAVGRRPADGGLRLALSGVGVAPLLVNLREGAIDAALADLDPPGDFRGSSEYRRALAEVLAKRVLEELGEVA
jgi:CO/xanthine dehydrogenase FAD-binding subunit